MEILGYASALLIGLSLGLIGGGGSILTVPVLTYLMGVNAKLATAYSLFVVGVSALVGAVKKSKQGLVDYKTGIIFAIPALSSVYFTRAFLVPRIPEVITEIGSFVLTDSIAIMSFFAIVMLLAAYSMIKGRKEDNEEEKLINYNYPMIIIEGIIVGLVTGIIGAGGGFLIIPALVVLAKLPVKKAIGTSLMIISFKSLIGFIGDVQNPNLEIDWQLLSIFSAIAVAGIFIGTYLTKFVSANGLKKGFGYFIVIMALFILFKELA
jgi:hypothetical protein